MAGTLDQRVERSFLGKVADKIGSYAREARFGLSMLVAAGICATAQPTLAQAPSWTVERTGAVTNGDNTITHQYKVTNNSENNSDYNLLTLTAGTGSDDQVNDASGGYQGDIGTWNKIINQSQTSFSVGSGEPIYASGNPLADFGTFYITSAEQNTALIPFNARAQNGESFATTNIIEIGRAHV